MTGKDAHHRCAILTFHKRHSTAATIEAFGISARTLSCWHTLKHHGSTPAARTPRSCTAPTSSRNATIILDALCHLLPTPPRAVRSDDGAECMGAFHKRLDQRTI